MAFKFYIDTFLTDQPNNDMELVTTIKRDSDLGGFLTTQEVTLTYSKNTDLEPGVISGYTYLKNLFDSGSCNAANIEIRDEVSATETYRVYSGVIKVPAIEIDEQRFVLSTKIDDNGFYAFIANNRNIKFNLFATKTKNGLPITPPQVYEVNMFDSATGTLLGAPGAYWKGYRIYDVLAFLCGVISDNRVGFESDFLNNHATSIDIELFIFDGFALANPNANPAVTVSLGQILDELNKLKNLSFYIDQTDPDNPIFRLEQASWFFIGSNVLTFNEPLHVKTSVKATKLYGTVRAGSNYNPCGIPPTYTWLCGTSYYGWKDEVYTPYGQCNTDNELNLVNDFLIASNAVNDQVTGATTSNLEAVFLVECWIIDDVLFTAQATDYDTYATAPVRYYNIGLNNIHKIGYHGANFQSALTNTADAGLDIFHATSGSDITLMDQTTGSGLVSLFNGTPAVVVPVPFTDENGPGNFDPGNNYSNLAADSYYTVPVIGSYSFKTNLHLELLNFKACTTPNNTALQQLNIPTQFAVIVTVDIEAYTDATFTTLINIANANALFSQDGIYNLPLSFVSPLPVGAVVRVRSQCQFAVLFPTIFGNSPLSNTIINGGICGYQPSDPKARVFALEDSTFECNGTPDGGLVLAQPDPALYKIKQHEFDYHINQTDFRTLQALPIGRFEFIKDEVSRFGWIEELSFNNWTGQAKIKLITQDASI